MDGTVPITNVNQIAEMLNLLLENQRKLLCRGYSLLIDKALEGVCWSMLDKIYIRCGQTANRRFIISPHVRFDHELRQS